MHTFFSPYNEAYIVNFKKLQWLYNYSMFLQEVHHTIF